MSELMRKGNTVHLPASGELIHSCLLLFSIDDREPEPGRACWLLLAAEGEIEWEFGEWQDGKGTGAKGWYLIGESRPINEFDYRIEAWAYPPPIPPLPFDDAREPS